MGNGVPHYGDYTYYMQENILGEKKSLLFTRRVSFQHWKNSIVLFCLQVTNRTSIFYSWRFLKIDQYMSLQYRFIFIVWQIHVDHFLYTVSISKENVQTTTDICKALFKKVCKKSDVLHFKLFFNSFQYFLNKKLPTTGKKFGNPFFSCQRPNEIRNTSLFGFMKMHD